MFPITILFLPKDSTAAEELRRSLDGIEVAGIRWTCGMRPVPNGRFRELDLSRDLLATAGARSGLVGIIVFMPGHNKQARKTFVACQERYEREGKAFVHWVKLDSKGPLEV